jgi:hypothetical protein
LVAAGLALCLAPLNYGREIFGDISLLDSTGIALLAFGAGGAMIGAGILAPFHRKATGAQIGFVLGGVCLALLAVMGM